MKNGIIWGADHLQHIKLMHHLNGEWGQCMCCRKVGKAKSFQVYIAFFQLLAVKLWTSIIFSQASVCSSAKQTGWINSKKYICN